MQEQKIAVGPEEWANNLNLRSAILLTHRIFTSSLMDINNHLWHAFLICFLQKSDSHQMETADHKHVDPRPVRTRRLMMLTPEISPGYLAMHKSESCAPANHTAQDPPSIFSLLFLKSSHPSQPVRWSWDKLKFPILSAGTFSFSKLLSPLVCLVLLCVRPMNLEQWKTMEKTGIKCVQDWWCGYILGLMLGWEWTRK